MKANLPDVSDYDTQEAKKEIIYLDAVNCMAIHSCEHCP
jgi:ATP-dependent protease Clp ATPase subunit